MTKYFTATEASLPELLREPPREGLGPHENEGSSARLEERGLEEREFCALIVRREDKTLLDRIDG